MAKKELFLIGLVGVIAIIGIIIISLENISLSFATVGQAITAKAIPKTISCSDSDSGPDLTVLGTTIGPETKRSTAVITKDDYCKDSETIVEYICEDGLLKEQEYGDYVDDRDYRISCDCVDGACTNMYKYKIEKETTDVKFKSFKSTIKQKYQLGECYDSDEGSDWYTKGTITGGEVSYTDVCCTGGENCGGYTDSGRLKEYYCTSEEELTMAYVQCPSGYSCNDGACVAVVVS